MPRSDLSIRILMLAVTVFSLAVFAAAPVRAGSLWTEDWSNHNLDNWYLHTYRAPVDQYLFESDPDTFIMRGNAWGVESKQHFNHNAPFSVETSIMMPPPSVDPNDPCKPDFEQFAGLTIYNGESLYEEMAFVRVFNGDGMRIMRWTESMAELLPDDPGSGFINNNLPQDQFYDIRIDYDGHGNWSYHVNGALLLVASGKVLDSAPNIFILSVADFINDGPQDPCRINETQFRTITVKGYDNLFSGTSWIPFTNQDNSAVTAYVENRGCAFNQCDFLELERSQSNPDHFLPQGHTVSPAISVPDEHAWGQVFFTNQLNGQNIFVQLLNADGYLLPDSVLPGNSTGFRNGPINISGIDHFEYPTLKLKASFSTSDPSETPRLLDWTLTFGKPYYFTWYDQVSKGMKDWLLMSSSNIYSSGSDFSVQLGSPAARPPTFYSTNPGTTSATTFPGVNDGHVTVNSLSGLRQVVSQRVLYGGSMQETLAISAEDLSNHYYWAWYDENSPGFKNWILVANPNPYAVYYEIKVGDSVLDSGYIGDGQRVTPRFPGVIGGPVEVLAYTDGSKTAPAKVVASQRVLSHDDKAFNETVGTPGENLSDQYIWSWYDNLDGKNWILVANPNPYAVYYEIKVGDSVLDSGYIGDGQRVTPRFPGVIGGPVEVLAYTDGSKTAPAKVVASQRIIWGPSFEENPGYPVGKISSSYHWTWYDDVAAEAANWLIVANRATEPVTADVFVAGVRIGSLELQPAVAGVSAVAGRRFEGKMGGPAEVRAYIKGGSYARESDRREVFASQRTLWLGHLTEVNGTTLD